MKRVISELVKTRCRASEITEEERNAFSHYSYLQRYHPGLDLFKTNDACMNKNIALPTQHTILSWKPRDSSDSQFVGNKYWVCTLQETKSDDNLFYELLDNSHEDLNEDLSGANTTAMSSTTNTKTANVFVKIIHLLDPIGILRQEYMTPEHPLLPQGERAWRHTLQKLHSPNNQAYVDAVANFVLSKFRELDLTPHCTLYYGSMTGIAKSYKYRLTDDYESYKQNKWFWRGIQSHGAKLEVLKENENILNNPEYEDIIKEHFTCPFTDDDTNIVSELSIDNLPTMETIDEDIQSLHSFTFNDPATPKPELFISEGSGMSVLGLDTEQENDSRNSQSENEESIEEDSEDDDDDDFDESQEQSIEVNLELPSMPVILVYQECQEGTMDELLEKETLCGFERGSKEWETMWLAWTWQIISVLSFLQRAICFTHNDLHTNNILWRTTTEEYIYYKSRDGTVWRIPTYGKIFSLIDFGRSIFRLGKQLWISDDHWPEHEAGGQYNFGPIYNIKEQKVVPNPSFDLCRLAISMIDGLFDEIPKKKKGKIVQPLSKDGSWIVHESVSPLFNLLFSWTIDDEGKTIYQDQSGDERYHDFSLYVHIARDIHTAVPREQFTKPFFDKFRFTQKVPGEQSIYLLGY